MKKDFYVYQGWVLYFFIFFLNFPEFLKLIFF